MNSLNVKFGLRDMFLEGVREADQLAGCLCAGDGGAEIDARGLKHKELNDLLRRAVLAGYTEITVKNVCGQRYIGTRLYFGADGRKVRIKICGTPGNDLGAFLNGHRIVVSGNAQDGVGNTMDGGEIVVHGRAGDIAAMSMRGGKIFIRDNVGYRAAIHMKEYGDRKPLVVIGGTAHDFLGEYMAGGTVIMLGLGLAPGEGHRACFIGTGMHGGVIYLRGEVAPYQLGKEVGILEPDEEDQKVLEKYVGEFATHFSLEAGEILKGRFIKLLPVSKRPYGRIYAY